MSLSGFPHSEILGSKPVCGSPKLIAAYHVLHRLLAPRHSPYALSSLTIKNSILCLPKLAPRHASDRCTLRVWSEKTTVCRIFSCQRPESCLEWVRALWPLNQPSNLTRRSIHRSSWTG